MTLDLRKNPVLFSALTGGIALAVLGSFPPLWSTARWVGSGPWHSTLWRELRRLLLDVENSNRTLGGLASAAGPYEGTLVFAAIIFTIGGWLGCVFYWWRWERRRDLPG